MKKIFTTFLLFLLMYSLTIAADRRAVIDSVKINSNYLALDCRAEGLIDDKIAEGLLKGRTSILEYKIQLWGKKSGLLNQLVNEQFIRMKVNYDFWENKYVIEMPEEKRLTSSIETVREKCTELIDFQIMLIENLKPGIKYTITIEIILRPLSVKNYQEIKNWLGGEVKDIDLKKLSNAEKQEKGFKNRLLRMFMAITGFGERVLSTKTEQFKIKDNQIVWQ